MKPAILYARFSPRPNAAECESVTNQLRDLREWCSANEYEIVSEHKDEALSGASVDRPGLWDAMDALKKGQGCTLLITAFDRLARDNLLSEILHDTAKKKGAQIVSITQQEASRDTPEAKFFRGILSCMAEYQRAQIRAKTRSAMQRKQREGRRMSNICAYGWRRDEDRTEIQMDGKITRPFVIKDDQEQELIQEMNRLHQAGLGWRGIAREMEKEGHLNRGKSNWNHTTIKKTLQREGLLEGNGTGGENKTGI